MKGAYNALALFAMAAACFGQKSPIAQYLDDVGGASLVTVAPASRTNDALRDILPLNNASQFADYAATRLEFGSVVQSVETLRLNKLIAGTPGPSGATALVSRVSVPSILGFATEYGGILQTGSGNISTLRANFLGVAGMIFGQEMFPYCPLIDEKNCQPASKWLRKFSGALSFASTREPTETGTAAAPNTPPTPVALFGSDYRMSSWSLRFDITANDPADPKYRQAWRGAIASLRADPASAKFVLAISDVFKDAVASGMYGTWQADALTDLKNASPIEFERVLQRQLDLLIQKMAAADAGFQTRIASLRRAFMNYTVVRDELLREIQRHKASLEYTNQHPLNQPNTSNLRFIYSHQPSRSPTLVTANFAMTWFHELPSGASGGRFRDLQIAGQLDRRLGEIPNFGNAVATFGGYYQWMKEDALIQIGPGNVAPGSGIVLPNTAAKLLGTKGHIGVVQGKLTIPVNNVVKVPISVTWANRTELINEKDVRGQVGMTLDIDSLFRR